MVRPNRKTTMPALNHKICTFWMITYGPQYDIVICDQVSIVVPILRFCGYKVIFYCHYPDKLLSGKSGFFKKIYRQEKIIK